MTPSMGLSAPYQVTTRTSDFSCPKRSTRPSRCSWRVGFQAQVVVQDGIEVLLEVDAFGEAVGAHEHEPAAAGPRISGQPGDARLALGVRQPAGDRLHPDVLRERVAQVPGDVLRGVDEAAEDDGVEAVPEERLDLAHRALKLPVVRGIQRLRAARELQQPAARRFGAPFGLRAGAEVERHRIVVVALVEDGAASHLVHVPRLQPRRRRPGCATSRRPRRDSTRRSAAARAPDQYRTRRLRCSESSSATYSWAKARMSSKSAR